MKGEKECLRYYSIQLVFLSKLLKCKLIDDIEYSLIKKQLMKAYGITSDILARSDSSP